MIAMTGVVTRVVSPSMVEVQLGNALISAVVPIGLGGGIKPGDWVCIEREDDHYVISSWCSNQGL